MATYITDATGNNNAEIIGDFTTDDVAETLTFNSGTAGEAKPLKALETTRQWLVVEVREVGGVAGVIGKHVYSEDVTDIQTRVEAIRQEMIALHSAFVINCIHYKTGDVCDVYRGDKTTVVALDALDTNTAFTPPAIWVIDDLTSFAPQAQTGDVNIIVDSGFDSAGDWNLVGAGLSVSGSKLNATGTTGNARATLTTPIEAGATYEITLQRDAISVGAWRLQIDTAYGDWLGLATGPYTKQITANENDAIVEINFTNDLVGTFDDFTCTKV